MTLKNKRILITAGPTWVPIDSVRVISNIASGQTGILLAQILSKTGAKVDLLLGPGCAACCIDKKVKVTGFNFYDDLRDLVQKKIKSSRYDIIIHSAAVSDFAPEKKAHGKISSRGSINLKLKPLPKIIADIRRLAPKAKLVMFKLESAVSDQVLIKRAKAAQAKANAEIVAANRINPYSAFIIEKSGNISAVKNKPQLIRELVKKL